MSILKKYVGVLACGPKFVCRAARKVSANVVLKPTMLLGAASGMHFKLARMYAENIVKI